MLPHVVGTLMAIFVTPLAAVVVAPAAPRVLWSQSTVWNQCNGAGAPADTW